MRSLIYFFILASILFIKSCDYHVEYNFSEELVNHFPKGMENKINYFSKSFKSSPNIEHYRARKLEVYKYEGKIKEIADSFIEKSKYIVNYTDSCLIILPEYFFYKNVFNKPLIRGCINDTYVVIPSLETLNSFEPNYTNLSNYICYVLDMEQGEFIEEYNLLPKKVMPSPWTNGYTKGISLNKEEQKVVFWIYAW